MSSSLHGIAQPFLHLVADAVLCRFAVQRVVYAHPRHGEISSTAQLPISEHLRREVAQFDIERPQFHLLSNGSNHTTKDFLLLDLVESLVVCTLTIDSAMPIDEWRNPCAPCPHHSQQACHDSVVLVLGKHHIRGMSWCLLVDEKQLPAMEKILTCPLWQGT